VPPARLIVGGVLAWGVWNVTLLSLRQGILPDRLMGPVVGAIRLVGFGTIPLGALLGGLVARTLGCGHRTFSARPSWPLPPWSPPPHHHPGHRGRPVRARLGPRDHKLRELGVLAAEPCRGDPQADGDPRHGLEGHLVDQVHRARTVATVRQTPPARTCTSYGASGRASSQVSVAWPSVGVPASRTVSVLGVAGSVPGVHAVTALPSTAATAGALGSAAFAVTGRRRARLSSPWR
jgi:hypothetical protein